MIRQNPNGHLEDRNRAVANPFITRIEEALLAQPSVGDCIVLLRTGATGAELVSYVVPTGPFRVERLLAAVRESLPDLALPLTFLPVSSIPLRDDGGVDEEVLAALPLADGATVALCRELFRHLPDTTVEIRENRVRRRLLHVSDLLPQWKGSATSDGEEAAVSELDARRSAQAAQGALSLVRGETLREDPGAPATLQAALQRAAASSPDKGIIYIQPDGTDKFQPYAELLERAERVLGGLRHAGLKIGDPVLFQLEHAEDFIAAFWGCTLGGLVPVPVSIAPAYDQANSAVAKLHHAWQLLDHPIVLASDALTTALRGIGNFLPADGLRVQPIGDLLKGPRDSKWHASQPDDLALLLLTSGSTGKSKAVMQSHHALLSRTAASHQMHGFTPQDVSLNWLALDHVGGIVMVHIHDVVLTATQVHARIQDVLADPLKWIDWLDRYHATSTWAPNFAFGLVNARADEIARRHWDLSKLRLIVNGGEAVISKTARRFLSLLATHGLRGTAMQPCWGMSETSSGSIFMRDFTLDTTSDDDPFVEVGEPLPGMGLRIVDADNQLVAEGVIGRLQVHGPFITSGYFRNPDANRESFTEDRWFITGDLGMIRNGRMTITGREKEVIIINGVNFHSHEIEKVVEEIPGIEPSFTAAFAVRDPGTETDRVAICFSPSEGGWIGDTEMAGILRQVRSKVAASFGVSPAHLIPVDREAIPKTSIGKIQRSELAARLRAGDFDLILKRVDLALETSRTIPDWFYRKTWKRREALVSSTFSTARCLIFADAAGSGQQLAHNLAQRGGSSVLVQRGFAFERLSPSLYSIDPTDPSQYVALLETLRAEGALLDAVVHFWACDTVSEPATRDVLDLALDTGVFSVLHLAQALQKVQGSVAGARLIVVTRGTQRVAGEAGSSAHSGLSGLLKTVGQELPRLTCRHIDLEMVPAAEDARLLEIELTALPGETAVAYRGAERWVSRLVNADLPSTRNLPLPFVQGGLYLVTGGLGAIGLEVARHLAKEYGARLLLLGRTALEGPDSAERQNALYQLRSLGGDARYEAGDVGDAAALERVVAAAEAEWQVPLAGVLHLAGVYQERLVADETRDTFRSTLNPKVYGTWAVRQMLQARPDAFLIGFSSINGFFGGFSSGAYAGANSFLDGSIEQEQAEGRRATSLAWSLWDETGMSRGYAMKDRSRAQGYIPVPRLQGLRSFLAALQSNQPVILIGLDGGGPQVRRCLAASLVPLQQLVIVTSEQSRPQALNIARDISKDRFGSPVAMDVVVEAGGALDATSSSRAVSTQPATELERAITRIWADALGTDVDLDGNFFDLGGSSVLAAQVYQKIHELVGDRLTMTDLFQYPTVRTLCQHLAAGEDDRSGSLHPRGAQRARPGRSAAERGGEPDIAIIGMAGRFPGARNIHEFWRNIRDGVEAIRPLARKDLERAGVSAAALDDPAYVSAASTLDDVEMFDAAFFGFSPREASLLDPQARFFLESAWEALESAGYNPQNTGKSVGVFASQSLSTYLLENVHPELALGEFVLGGGNLNAILGNGSDFLPTRVSYKLNLSGPSINVQTACSSSLVAVHMARQALLVGECDMALAGGVSIYLPQGTGYRFQEGMILSPDGHCRPFDAEARGTIFGRGVGVVVLKPLTAAIREGDEIYAVIKGSAINNDGAGKVGYTAPAVDGQAHAIAQALANSGVGADTISYVEAHGTGTPQGDPIEIAALTRAFRETTAKSQFCALGSVKGNVGHLDVAAGITSLIKTTLMLKHRTRPPSLNFTRPNPQIDFANSPFYVNAAIDEWPSEIGPRRAGVSSFGMGGTNAHLILEEAPEIERPTVMPDRPVHVLALSAKTPEALRMLADRQAAYLDETPASLADVCYTAAVGRAHWKHRAAVVSDCASALRDQLRLLAQETDAPKDSGSGAPPLAFLFTGQGSQYPGMARQLYNTHPAFRSTIDRCNEIVGTGLPKPLIEVIYPADPNDRAVDATNFTQPALFAVEYALAELWRSWGIVPAAVIGHSIGEYVAACVAGVFSLEDALHLVVERARLMHAAPGSGEMVAVFAAEKAVTRAISDLADRVTLAAINGPAQVVVSGERDAIAVATQRFDSAAMQWQRLAVSHAFHSPCMDPVLDEFERALDGVHFQEPQIAVISNVSGRAARAGELINPGYWRRHLRQPVRFADGIKSLLGLGYGWFVEVGPHPALTGLAKTVVDDPQTQWLPSLRRGADDWSPLLQSLAALYVGGASIDWNGFDAPYARRRVALPTYPFERQRHWIDAPRKSESKPMVSALPGQRLKSPAMTATVFEAVVSTEQSYLNDHRLFGMAVFPATGYLAAALGAADLAFGDAPVAIEGLTLAQALIIPDGERRLVQSVLKEQGGGVSQFQFFSERLADGKDNDWVMHASGTIRKVKPAAPTTVDLAGLRKHCTEPVDVAGHYAALNDRGLQFGPAFRGLRELSRTASQAVGHVVLSEQLVSEAAGKIVHPAFLDAAQQTLIQAVGDRNGEPGILVPVSVDRLLIHQTLPHSLWSHARVSSCGSNCYSAEIRLYDEAGMLVGEVDGLRVQRVQAETLKRATQRDPVADWLYEVEWQADSRTYSEVQATAPALVAPMTLAEQIAPMFASLGVSEGLPRYREMLSGLEQLCGVYAERAFAELGWRPALGERFTAESLAVQLGVLPRYRRLLRRLLEILQEELRLEIDGDGFRAAGPLAVGDFERLRNDLLKRFPEPEARVQIALVAACAEQLAGVMRGSVDPLQLLFPGGSVANLEELYGHSAFARVYNRLAGDAIAAACAGLPKGQQVRVIEVGAGTGGTTRYVLPKLQQPGVEYVFTDVGNLFLHKARENFKQYPNVRFEILDVERDPLTQGFAAHQFDIVLASNVLHATADLRQTLGYMKNLLAPEGLLVFVEGTGPSRWVDLTFGLTEGWWKFTDTDLRAKHPLLSSEQWIRTLRDLGFSEAASFPDVQRGEGDGWQIIGMARGPAMDAEALAQKMETRQDPWVIVADHSGFASRLRQQFALRGEAALAIHYDDLKHSLAQTATGGRRIRGIINLAPLDATLAGTASTGSLEDASKIAAGSMLSLVQAIAAVHPSDPPRLWSVTRGVHDVAGKLEASALPQSLVWGLGRTLAFEYPELRGVRIDLDLQDPDAANKLCQEILAADDEDQIAIRGCERRVARLVRKNVKLEPDSVVESEEMRSLTIGQRGVLDNLQLASAARKTPGPFDAEIRVRATGLNFRDVLNALGMYPGPVPPFGGECAGTVVRVGEKVRAVRPGDEVVALAYDSFATFATTREEFVALKPAALTFQQAASLPVAFLTAGYALKSKAKLSSGERVLIHAAAGGVGYAAVQIAQRAGAEIFATAGSEEKREWLRSAGVQHVFDSRTTAFAAAILERTGGAGVDVVLNSLAGDFIAASMSAIASGGRFVELGKSGIWDPAEVSARHPHLKYFVIDFAADSESDPSLVSGMLPEIVADAAAGKLHPLPVKSFPLEHVVDAFRFMAQAKHTGKIVVTQAPAARGDFRSNACYLITGGLGALGLAVAKWMTARGARHFVLMGRRAATAEALAQIHEIEELGASITVVRGDVSRAADVQRVVHQIAAGPVPLRGVIHAAGALDDGVLLQQTWQRFQHVFDAKVNGAWNLHTATAGVPLDFFVLFSSTASLLGSAGQGNHAAANAFLDALAFTRRHSGLAGLSINWGPWSEIGAAATVPAILDRVRLQGMEGIPPEEGLRVFGGLVRSDAVQVGVLPVDWKRFVAPLGDRVSPFFSQVTGKQHGASLPQAAAPAKSEESVVARALAAPAEERRPMLVSHIRDQVRRALGFDARYAIDDRQPLSNIGLDSLMAVELRNILGASLAMKQSLPATLLFDYPTIDTLADYLMGVLGLAVQESAVPSSNDSHAELVAEIEQLSEAEAELKLLEELAATSASRKGGQ